MVRDPKAGRPLTVDEGPWIERFDNRNNEFRQYHGCVSWFDTPAAPVRLGDVVAMHQGFVQQVGGHGCKPHGGAFDQPG